MVGPTPERGGRPACENHSLRCTQHLTGTSFATADRCCHCSDLQVPLPNYPTLATNNIVLKLRAREANDIFFRELSTVLGAVRATVESPALAPLASALLPAVLEETKVKLNLEQLSEACK